MKGVSCAVSYYYYNYFCWYDYICNVSFTLLLIITLNFTHPNVQKICSNVSKALVLWNQYVEQEAEIMSGLKGPFSIVQATRMKVSLYQGSVYIQP